MWGGLLQPFCHPEGGWPQTEADATQGRVERGRMGRERHHWVAGITNPDACHNSPFTEVNTSPIVEATFCCVLWKMQRHCPDSPSRKDLLHNSREHGQLAAPLLASLGYASAAESHLAWNCTLPEADSIQCKGLAISTWPRILSDGHHSLFSSPPSWLKIPSTWVAVQHLPLANPAPIHS